MYPWRVFIEGRNLLLDVDDEVRKYGLYVTRYVEAADESGAAEAAVAAVLADLDGAVLNDDADGPRFDVTEIEAVASPSEVPAVAPGIAIFDEAIPDEEESFVPELPVDESFAIARGCSLTDRGGLTEGFAVEEVDGADHTLIRVNVSAERLADVYRDLCELVDAPGFFVLETPTNRAVEEELRESDDDPLHVDVHYLDGLEVIDHRLLFDPLEELLVQCGCVAFGFGSHEHMDEVQVDGYKAVTVISTTPTKYAERLRALGFAQREELRTAWDTLGPETPGERRLVRVDGRTVYDVVRELGERGLYFAKRRAGIV